MSRLLAPRLCFLTAWAACAACATVTTRPYPPVPAAASVAFAQARRLQRSGDDAGARSAAREAAGLDPDWIAPRRFLDDIAQAELRAPEALARHRARLAEDAEDVVALYLAGRLEGQAGDLRFEQASRLDSRRGWAWHGRGWNAHRRGETRAALRHASRAFELARDPYERSYFAWARARIELEAGQEDVAAQLLLERLADPDTDHADRPWLGVALARLELESGDLERRRRGAYRALDLLEHSTLEEAEVSSLVEGVSIWGALEPGRAALHLALAARGDERGALERGRLLNLERPSELAVALLEGNAPAGDAGLRRLQFAVGDPAAGVESWRAGLPEFVLTDGLPRDPALAGLVLAAQGLGPREEWTPERTRAFGQALLAAGWFEEARVFASRIPGGDLQAALDLDARARAGRGVITRLSRLVLAMDHGRAREAPLVRVEPGAEILIEDGDEIDDLEGILTALAPDLVRAAPLVGGPIELETWTRVLTESPRLDYGLLGELIHPGPTYSEQDQADGLGRAGEPVEGLAQLLGRLGRFGLFGDGLGQAPDGVVMRRLLIEQRSGRHLGVDWSGTVVWCDGTDLPPRAGRGVTRIAGAALHEGYWIEVSVLRQEHQRWGMLLERFGAHLHEVLAVEPLVLGEDETASGTEFLLGAANRLRLAIMADRGGPITLEELCLVTAAHEEGHLCDRTRFFPFEQHWLSILGLFAGSGFSPALLAQRLEERAQLVALCVVQDPRVPLVDLLQAAEDGGEGSTPHGAAYERLCQQFLVELGSQMQAQPDEWTALDRGAFLGQQAHRLTAEQVRTVALALARKRGMVRGG